MKGITMMIVAKMKDKIVQIVRVAETVQFSEHRGWVLVCFDFDKPMRKRDHVRWMKASETHFEWVREFMGE
jgi:hypothetical protein